MAREWTATSFSTGDAVALRLPADAGLAPGKDWRLVEDGTGFRLGRLPAARRKIDVSKFWGKLPGLKLLTPEDRLFEEERPRAWPRPGDDDGK